MKYMNIIFGLLLISIIITSCFAESEKTFEELNIDTLSIYSVTFTPSFTISFPDNNPKIFLGAKTALTLYDYFSFGAFAFVNTSKWEFPATSEQDKIDIVFRYGGFEFIYIGFSEYFFHFTSGASVGVGYMNHQDNSDYFYVLEPFVNGELNLFKFLRLDFGLSYMLSLGINDSVLENSDFSGININLNLKFGKFYSY